MSIPVFLSGLVGFSRLDCARDWLRCILGTCRMSAGLQNVSVFRTNGRCQCGTAHRFLKRNRDAMINSHQRTKTSFLSRHRPSHIREAQGGILKGTAADKLDVEDEWEEALDEDEIAELMGDTEAFAPPEEPIAADDLEFAKAMAEVADGIKCERINLFDVRGYVYWTDMFLIITVFSRPQLNAVMGKMEKVALEKFNRTVEGSASGRSEWEAMDFDSVVIHVMSSRQREFYNLEGIYTKAPEIPLEFGPPDSAQWSASMKE